MNRFLDNSASCDKSSSTRTVLKELPPPSVPSLMIIAQKFERLAEIPERQKSLNVRVCNMALFEKSHLFFFKRCSF